MQEVIFLFDCTIIPITTCLFKDDPSLACLCSVGNMLLITGYVYVHAGSIFTRS